MLILGTPPRGLQSWITEHAGRDRTLRLTQHAHGLGISGPGGTPLTLREQREILALCAADAAEPLGVRTTREQEN